MSIRDWIGDPCSCPECRQAGITDRPVRRDPRSGENLHGYALKRWYAAYDEFRAKARAAVGAKGRHAVGFERLVKDESRSPDGDGPAMPALYEGTSLKGSAGKPQAVAERGSGNAGPANTSPLLDVSSVNAGAGSEPADSHSTTGGFEPLGKPQ